MMTKPSPLKAITQTVLVTACASSIVVLAVWAYFHMKEDEESKARKGVGKGDGRNHENAPSRPMFEFSNPILCDKVLSMARQRAKRWTSLELSGAHGMVGQVGGVSKHKRPVLICEPSLILKPLSLDHRGIREIAFYEAIQASAKRSGFKMYADLFGPAVATTPAAARILSRWFLHRNSKESGASEAQPFHDEKSFELETKLLHRVELFTSEYFGVAEYIEDSESSATTEGEFGLNRNMYIVLRNLTTHFSKPCVLDLKMGTQTYEPDAPEDKQIRERSKYVSQEEFGFRIIGMRIYGPSDVEACDDGYIYFPKQFGRSMQSRNQIKLALRTYFGGNHLTKEVRLNRSTAIKRILTKLKLIIGWFRDNTVFTFYASSLLMVYEGTTELNALGSVDPGT
jgi:Inositol polyphosphate kinase